MITLEQASRQAFKRDMRNYRSGVADLELPITKKRLKAMGKHFAPLRRFDIGVVSELAKNYWVLLETDPFKKIEIAKFIQKTAEDSDYPYLYDPDSMPMESSRIRRVYYPLDIKYALLQFTQEERARMASNSLAYEPTTLEIMEMQCSK